MLLCGAAWAVLGFSDPKLFGFLESLDIQPYRARPTPL